MANITANAETLMRHAGYTAEFWMDQAIECIDTRFGKGYAKAHPELIRAFMTAAAIDEHAAVLGKEIGEGFEGLYESLRQAV